MSFMSKKEIKTLLGYTKGGVGQAHYIYDNNHGVREYNKEFRL